MKGQSASLPECRTCTNLRSEHGKKYCDWLESYLERSALGGPCEGYVYKESGVKQKRGKDVGNDAGQATQDLEVTCPKTDPTSTVRRPEKAIILTALELKKLKGSVVLERVNCGKRGCRRCSSGVGHGPYPYLHYYDPSCPWKVRRKYLTKDVAKFMSYSMEELELQLREVEAEILGQHQRLKRESSPSELAEVSQR